MTVEASDTPPRRKREKAQSTGKAIKPTERDLIWFQKLHEHGPLSSSFLHAFTKERWPNEKKAKERFTDLFNEVQTPHRGPYLTRPKDQFKTMDARHHELVYGLAKPAEQALREAGHWQEHRAVPSGPWLHQYMTACITASIEIAMLARPDLTYIPASAILGRVKAKLRHPTEFVWPDAKQPTQKDLIPDSLFGLEYRQQGEKRYRFFVLETDRGTEPAKSNNFNRKSYLRHVLQYRDYIGHGGYREHLKLTAPLCVLNVATTTNRQQLLLRVLEELAGSQGCNYQLFQTYENFGEVFKPPPLDTKFLDSAWERVGCEPWRIDGV